MKYLLTALLIAAPWLAACDKKPSAGSTPPAVNAASAVGSAAAASAPVVAPASAPSEAPAKPRLNLPAHDLSSPEATLRSYWAAQDALAALRGGDCEECARYRQHLQGLSTGDMRAGLALRVYPTQVYEREIKETKVDKKDEHRVEVIAVIKNVSPHDPEAKPNDYVKGKRKNGDKYRYALVRGEAGWQITDMWVWYEPSRIWMEMTTGKPLVPVETHP